MTFGFTRDSALLTLTALVAGFGYLLTMPPPTQWTYYQWLQTASAAALFVSGWLKTPSLPHSKEGSAKIPPSGQ